MSPAVIESAILSALSAAPGRAERRLVASKSPARKKRLRTGAARPPPPADVSIRNACLSDFRHDATMQLHPLSDPAPEDGGAATTGRYRFQHCCAGARLLAAVAEARSCVVICEHHEDYLVVGDDGAMQAVSVKHREDHLAAWTIPSLAGDGKLGHLLDTFKRANGQIDCCFESNRANTVAGLFSEDAAVSGPLREDLAHRLSVTREDVDAFLARLTFPPAMPHRTGMRRRAAYPATPRTASPPQPVL